MMNELKPCPFCGGKAVLFHKGNTGNYLVYVRCSICKCQSKIFFTPDLSAATDPESEVSIFAADAWNMRA